MVTFRWLKRLRVVISLGFLFLIGFLFIDFAGTFSSTLYNGALYFQFIPSLLKFINLTTWIATGFIVVLVLNLLFGRVYCSFLCPLGTLQDISNYLSQKLKKKKRRKYSKPQNLVRYSFLIIPVVVFLFGSVLFFNLLDPYSNFGRIVSNLFKPIYFGLNNLTALILERQEIYSVKPVELKNISWLSLGYSVFIFGLVGYLSVKKGRLYCNTVCPVGTFLGIVSRVSLFKISLDKESCNSCGICANNCKANCINTKEKEVDFSRCVGCLDCLYVCPSSGVKFSLTKKNSKTTSILEPVSVDRRDFIKKSVLIPTALTALSRKSFAQGLIQKNKEGMIPIVRENPVTPPGSVTQLNFVESCTACTLCVSACPTQVLQPSFLEYGLAGMMQPRMDYKTSFCNFECVICSEVCPTGAIKPISLNDKKLTQLGKAKFVKENCVVYTDETACGACSEHCPTKAVNMVPYEKKPSITIPEVNDKICIGCGACEYACPTTPKSIYVEGNVEHVFAEKPKEVEVSEEDKEMEEFPF